TSNYLAAVVPDEQHVGIAWIDLSTGRFLAAKFLPEQLADELTRIDPVECLVCEGDNCLPHHFAARVQTTQRPAWAFAANTTQQTLARHFQMHSLEGFGFGDEDGLALRAAGAVLEYLGETQKTSL